MAALRVVSTTRKPSFANFWEMAPPTPQRTPTGRSLSSRSPPWTKWVLRPSDCHFDVAPMTTATGFRAEFIADSFLRDVDFPAVTESWACRWRPFRSSVETRPGQNPIRGAPRHSQWSEMSGYALPPLTGKTESHYSGGGFFPGWCEGNHRRSWWRHYQTSGYRMASELGQVPISKFPTPSLYRCHTTVQPGNQSTLPPRTLPRR